MLVSIVIGMANRVEWYRDDWEGFMNKECCGVETLVIRKNDLSFEFLNIYTDSKGGKIFSET